MKKLTILAAALVVAPLATAQMRPEISVGFDANLSAASVGAGFRSPMGALPITLAPHLDYYVMGDQGVALQGNVDGLYSFPGNTFSPYVGVGIGASYEKGDNNADNCTGAPAAGSTARTNCTLDLDGKIKPGVNFVFGGTMNGSTIRPYAQLRLSTGTLAGAGISAGLVF